jgi:hypothetical protein
MSSVDPDDQLREQLAALDPMAGRPVVPLPAETKEHAMTSTTERPTERSERRAVLLTMSACVAVVAAAVAVAIAFGGGSGSKDEVTAGEKPAGKKTVLQLTSTPGGAMAMCIQTSPETLRGAAHAFEGTATSVEGGTVSFDVTHWYKGGDQQVVTVSNPPVGTDGASTVEDGTTFEEGKTYLVAAGETEVGPCSGSGEKGPELEAMFKEAFGG